MSSVTQTYGANTAFIEDLYERYRANPESVSTSWREFFHDYEPRFEEEFEEDAAAQPQAVAPPVAIAAVPTPQPSNPATQQPVPAPPRPTPVPSNQTSVPLRGAAGKIAQNMETSLTIPTADRKSTRLNSSHPVLSRMPSSA